MDNGFVDRVAQEIRSVDGWHSLGAGALAEALAPFIEREAASALRSSGEAVAWTYRCRDARDRAVIARSVEELRGDIDLYPETWERLHPLYLHPATPASAPDWNMAQHWIDRYAGGIDDELQLDRVAEALGLPDPTPPTSSKGG